MERAMTFDEMNEQLPNGLHDAEIEMITYDLLAQILSMQVFVWVGTMDDPPALRERYRRAALRFEQTKFFAKSTPYNASDHGLSILSCEVNKHLSSDLKAESPLGENSYRIFTGYCELDIESNGFEFEWLEANETTCRSELNS
jgi:hypothetical protein